MMNYVSSLRPNNSLSFIDKRINDINYRGNISSEHNRYDMDEIYKTLVLLDKYAPNNELMRIRDTDLSKRPENTQEEYNYAIFCEQVAASVGKGTQDSIRKNIFVDLHRMGLINRYDTNKNIILPYERKSTKYISLTSEGLKFIKETNLLNRAFIFTRAIDTLLGGYVEITLTLLKDPMYCIDKITKYEFMFFVSAIDSNTNFSISLDECVKLIHDYRRLDRYTQKKVIEILSDRLQPKNFTGNKTDKKDWHNWKNKIDQIYHLFAQSPHFDVVGDILNLSTHKIKTKAGEIIDVMTRSIVEKEAYFTKHKVKRTPGFELHHVVPLSWAENPEQYKLFDKWENMVYIDAYRHAIITQNRNRNVEMRSEGNNIWLIDHVGNIIKLNFEAKNILYDPENQSIMLDYNKELRNCL